MCAAAALRLVSPLRAAHLRLSPHADAHVPHEYPWARHWANPGHAPLRNLTRIRPRLLGRRRVRHRSPPQLRSRPLPTAHPPRGRRHHSSHRGPQFTPRTVLTASVCTHAPRKHPHAWRRTTCASPLRSQHSRPHTHAGRRNTHSTSSSPPRHDSSLLRPDHMHTALAHTKPTRVCSDTHARKALQARVQHAHPSSPPHPLPPSSATTATRRQRAQPPRTQHHHRHRADEAPASLASWGGQG